LTGQEGCPAAHWLLTVRVTLPGRPANDDVTCRRLLHARRNNPPKPKKNGRLLAPAHFVRKK
jgi:hypothetical protein